MGNDKASIKREIDILDQQIEDFQLSDEIDIKKLKDLISKREKLNFLLSNLEQ